MIGFDRYNPRSWLAEGLLKVLVPQPERAENRKQRKARGMWNVALGMTLLASSVTCIADGTSQNIGRIDRQITAQQGFFDLDLPDPSDRVPEGYWDRLTASMRVAETLPERPYFDDPV